MNNFNKLSSLAQAASQIMNPQPEVAKEQLQEGWDDMIADVKKRNGPQPSGGSGIKQGSRYGGSKQKDEPEAEEKPKAKKKKPFSEMVSSYKEVGLKSLQEWAKKKKAMAEEASNEEFTKEVKEAQAKSEGKGKKAEVAKAAVQSVQQEETEQLDELSKDTLTSYVGAAKQDNKDHADSRRSGDKEEAKYAKDRMVKRSTGIGAAQNRLNKEDIEQVDEELKGNQHKIDKNKNNKIDAHDFKLLRKEDAEQIVEYETDKNGRYVHKAKPGNYGGSEKPADPFAAVRGPKQSDLSAIEAEKRKKKKKFSEMVDTFQTGGIKELFKEMAIEEEASQEEFNAELEKQKKKAEGKGEQAEVAKAAVQAVQQEETETEIQVINADVANGVDSVTIEERSLTDDEEETKEKNVKSMKKNMAGFKERYGKDAKSVMYATATKQAKGE